MATPKKVGPRVSTSTKKAPTPKYQNQPKNIIYEPKLDAVLAVEKEIEGLLPHDLLRRTALGKPNVITYPTERYHENGTDYDLIYVSEIIYPTQSEIQKSQIESAGYFQPKLSAIATQKVEKKVISVMEVPHIEADEWEAKAIKQAEALEEKARQIV